MRKNNDEKGKAVAELDESNEHEKQVKRKIPRAMGLKKALRNKKSKTLQMRSSLLKRGLPKRSMRTRIFGLRRSILTCISSWKMKTGITRYTNACFPVIKKEIKLHTSKSSNCKTNSSKPKTSLRKR